MLKFHLLGRPQITLNDQPVDDFASEKEMLLLCYLACNPGEHSRTKLAGLLWSESGEARARANLSTAIYNLRQLLPQALEATRKTAALNPDQIIWLDTAFLKQAANEDGQTVKSAVKNYRGPFLEGIYPQEAPELESWLQQERERWRLQALTLLDRLAQEQTQAGKWPEAIATLRRLLDLEPWREESHRLLMRLLASTGQFNAALVQYETCRSLLLEELAVPPMAQTSAVYERIKAARHRTNQNTLPPPLSPLVGRTAEMGELFLWLHSPEQRLITLAGPGGIGKTHLALAAANSFSYTFLDGTYFIQLGQVESKTALVQAITSALGLTPTAGEETTQLINFLRDKELLLVLDNVEQIVEITTDLIIELLKTAPRLCLLVTSREYLQLRSETRLPLTGLPFPSNNPAHPPTTPISEYESVNLFVQNAQRIKPLFQLGGNEQQVASLCRLVEGLPLAIELAAALVESQTPQQILTQVENGFDSLQATMRDYPKRHQGLRAVFEYSWQLLTPVQQEALTRLALFQGGFTVRAGEVIAAAGSTLLSQLVNKSLIREESNGRYNLHKVIQQYALEYLQNKTRAAVDHAAHFATQIKQSENDLRGPNQTAVTRQLLADLANIETAWQTAVSTQNVDLLLQMAPGLTRFYQVAGLFQAGTDTFNSAVHNLPSPPTAFYIFQAAFLAEKQDYDLAQTAVETALAEGLNDPDLVAQAHLILANIHLQQGRTESSRQSINRAMAAAEAVDKPWLQAQVWLKRGLLAEQFGNYAEAEEAIRQALSIYKAAGDPLGLAKTYHALGTVNFRQEDMESAKEMLEKALAMRRQVDTSGLISARILVNLGSIIGNLGQEEESRRYFQEALAVFQQTGDRSGAALASDMLGETFACRYDFDQASTYLDQALTLRQEIGQLKGIADARRHLADLDIRLGAYDSAWQTLTDILGTYQSIQDRRSEGTTLARLALVRACLGDYETAEHHAHLALDIAREIDNSLLRAYALTSLGHALRWQEKFQQAAAAYQEAIDLWQQWDAAGLKAEIQAAFATVQHAANLSDETWPALDSAVNCLLNNPQPDCDILGQLYLDCILLLQDKGDTDQAATIHQQAIDTLNHQAASITQPQAREIFLNNITAHLHLFNFKFPLNPSD